ncbi:hypothetical protein NDU88_007395 [Pleurodeles waltl]|uniref:Uncharacterized protein n=1 Tax=Pleurodeles waltl TaxID=8319 RepID=A0AAV7U1B9_PLEWA|nr:hypothetical protein NDU88_007395 [Pleurodeles waltl]
MGRKADHCGVSLRHLSAERVFWLSVSPPPHRELCKRSRLLLVVPNSSDVCRDRGSLLGMVSASARFQAACILFEAARASNGWMGPVDLEAQRQGTHGRGPSVPATGTITVGGRGLTVTGFLWAAALLQALSCVRGIQPDAPAAALRARSGPSGLLRGPTRLVRGSCVARCCTRSGRTLQHSARASDCPSAVCLFWQNPDRIKSRRECTEDCTSNAFRLEEQRRLI